MSAAQVRNYVTGPIRCAQPLKGCSSYRYYRSNLDMQGRVK